MKFTWCLSKILANIMVLLGGVTSFCASCVTNDNAGEHRGLADGWQLCDVRGTVTSETQMEKWHPLTPWIPYWLVGERVSEMCDTNLFGETDPTRRTALGSCVNSMLIWKAKSMRTVPAGPARTANSTKVTGVWISLNQNFSQMMAF